MLRRGARDEVCSALSQRIDEPYVDRAPRPAAPPADWNEAYSAHGTLFLLREKLHDASARGRSLIDYGYDTMLALIMRNVWRVHVQREQLNFVHIVSKRDLSSSSLLVDSYPPSAAHSCTQRVDKRDGWPAPAGWAISRRASGIAQRGRRVSIPR